MLVLTRKKRQTIVIGDPRGGGSWVVITVLEVARGRVQIGLKTNAVDSLAVPIHRGERWGGDANLPPATAEVEAGGAGRDEGELFHDRPAESATAAGEARVPAGVPASRMHDIVAAARSRQRPAQPVVVESELITAGR